MGVDALQYGALGLLAVVLAAVGLFLRGWLNRDQDRRDRREAREERLADEMRGLVEADVGAKVALAATLDGLCDEVKGCREGQVAVADVLREMVEGQRRHEERALDRHRALIDQQTEVVDALKALNGKR